MNPPMIGSRLRLWSVAGAVVVSAIAVLAVPAAAQVAPNLPLPTPEPSLPVTPSPDPSAAAQAVDEAVRTVTSDGLVRPHQPSSSPRPAVVVRSPKTATGPAASTAAGSRAREQAPGPARADETTERPLGTVAYGAAVGQGLLSAGRRAVAFATSLAPLLLLAAVTLSLAGGLSGGRGRLVKGDALAVRRTYRI